MFTRKLGWFIAACLLVAVPPTFAQERFGGLSGTVTDQSEGALPGATITITNAVTGAVRTIVTAANGGFDVKDLEPGRYNIVVELQGFQKLEAYDVLILLGRTAQLSAQLKLGAVSEVVQVTAEAVRQIDMSTTTIAANITAEELDRMPKGRTFQDVALASPGVNRGDIEGGIQVNGASGAENSFTVDGVNTNSVLYGSSRENTVFEYLQEVQVKTGGISAEYGGALGGVISAVTKSGGNKFSGEAHAYYIGNGLSAGPVPRLQLSPVDDTTVYHVQDPKQQDNRYEIGGSMGGPIVKDRLFFFGSYSPRLVRQSRNYLFSNGTEPGSLSNSQTITQLFGKVTYSSKRIQANGSVLYTPTTSTGTLSAYNGTTPTVVSSSLAGNAANIGRGYKIEQTNYSGNVDIYLSDRSFLSVRGGLFSDNYIDTGVPLTTSVTWQGSSVGMAGIPANLQQPIGYQNTPRVQVSSKDQTKMGLLQVDYHYTFNAGGLHTIKGGVGVRHAMNDANNVYPGGYVYLYWGQSFTNNAGQVGRGTYGYYSVTNFGTQGVVSANMPSLYVQDTWTVGDRLTLNLGVRTERETVPSFRTSIKPEAFTFGFGSKIAPRLGASYDVRGDGKVKVFGSWGRYFDWVKYELARGSFGGDTYLVYYRSLDTTDVYNINLNNMPGTNLWSSPVRDRRVPNFNTIDPDLKPMSQDAINVGTEFQLTPRTVLTVNYVHNNLRRTIEDVGSLDAAGNEVYWIANPGEGLATMMATTGTTPAALNTAPKPVRTYDALDLTVTRRFSENWFVSANVVFSRLYGNYAGLANSDEISTPTTGVSSGTAQQQGGSIARPGTSAGRAWDLDELEWDSHGNHDPQGRLATDRPVVAKLYGAYRAPFGTQVGLFQYVGSGTPISTVVNTTNTIPVFVNGRGDMGRTPTLSRTDLLVSHELSLAGSRKVRFELNVINLFNQQTATHIFNSYNKGAGVARADAALNLSTVNLAKGYDYKAMVLASPAGAGALDPRYGQPDLWQTGTQGQFSVKFLF